MRVKVYPSEIKGEVFPPSSKSIAHRMIIGSCLAKGRSIVKNVSFSKDIEATVSSMEALGARIERNGTTLEIEGIGGKLKAPTGDVFCGESGSTLRFLIPLFSLTGEKVRFTGEGRLLSRPQTVYEKLFSESGGEFFRDETAISVKGALKSGVYEVDGNVSSQFITGLMFALPLAEGDSEIKINPPFESKSYVDITLGILKGFGIEAFFKDELTVKIRGGQSYRPIEASVEGDFSQAAFFAVMSALKGRIKIGGMRENSLQGDKVIIDILKNAGSDISFDGGYYYASAGELSFETIDISDCPDLGPILTVLLAMSKSGGKIVGAERLRLKESDRIFAMEECLKKAGVAISSTEGEITVSGRNKIVGEVEVSSFNDHRVVMSMAAFAVLGENPIIIENAEAVSKSYPDFFRDLESLGVKVEYLC